MLSARIEDELLVCCARNFLNQEEIVRIRSLIRENLDWQYLIEMAQRHGVMPLFHKSLSSACPQAVPPAIMETLQKYCQANDRRNLFLTGELIKLLHLFERNDIKAVPFKGPALAASVYGDLALRQFSDLDILIQKQDVLKTKDLLVSFGYTPAFQFRKIQANALLRYQYELPFVHKSGKIFVELQWELAPRYLNCALVSNYLWNHFNPAADSTGLPLVQPEYLLLMLCIHGTKDFWRQLIWVCDVAELVRIYKDLDWASVMTLAENLGCQRMLYLGLFLAEDILGAHLPDSVIRVIVSDGVVKRLAKQVTQMLFHDKGSMPAMRNLVFYLQSKERPADQFLYCFRMMTTISPRDWTFLPLPSSLFFLYYVLRPIRLISKYLLRLQI